MTRWEKIAKAVIRAEMGRRDMTYADLASALKGIGVDQTEFNVRNKIGRGSFSAPFLFQCLTAMDVESVNLNSLLSSMQRENEPRAGHQR